MAGFQAPLGGRFWAPRDSFATDGSSHFGFVVDGPSVLETPQGRFELQPGMYFCVSGSCSISQGRGIVMSRVAFDGLFQIGGPVEKKGRLKYIDGCTDTLLISPIKLGDPCLNLLCFPEGIDQTSHTHPSDRIGVVCRGRGDCVTPERTIELTPGLIFRIHADGEHNFRTLKGSEMSVVAFHPDSDFGPTDQFHPMINRTIVDGISASMLKEIHTR